MLLPAFTIFVSACLLFLIQPIIAKLILPWFGGSAGVWTTCLLFFQIVLLAGYAYAHALTEWFEPRRQLLVHAILLLASLLLLPIIPAAWLKPAADSDAALRILMLLALTIGLPYFLLSATGPLLQSWVSRRLPSMTVYRLFALSNAGSLIGLLAFPFAIEPFANSPTQAWVWSGAYGLFVVACIATGFWMRRGAAAAIDDGDGVSADVLRHADPGVASGPPQLFDYLIWLALAATGSVLLLGATSHISQNIAAVPFLWILPLALYLASFIVAFEGRGGRGWYDARFGLPLAVGSAVAMTAGLSIDNGVLDIAVVVPLYCLGLFFSCLFCHGELAQRKPAPRYLTHFYLALAAGGALGGLAVALIAPRVFPAYYELPIALCAVCALALLSAWHPAGARRAQSRLLRIGWAIALTGVSVAAGTFTWHYAKVYDAFLRRDLVAMHRDFYGALRILETGADETRVRRLLHGVILHGAQWSSGALRLEPVTYYARSSGVGLAIEARQRRGPVRIGVVGLGTGTLAAYGRAGDVVRFYELNPAMVEIARTQFGYVGSSQAAVEFAVGDARLSLERELSAGQRQRFDVLAIDAFSSDSIPVHLLTREAIALFAQHLASDGIIAIHVSNRFLDLKPVVARLAAENGLQARLVDDQGLQDLAALTSDWVLLARKAADLDGDPVLAQRAQALAVPRGTPLWSDRHNNLLSVLRTNPLRELGRRVGLD